MNITSKLVNIELEKPFDNKIIEGKLKELGITPLRWAIVKCGSRVWKLEGRALLACKAATSRWRRKRLPGKLHRSIKVESNNLTISLAYQNL